ncbi:FUSC family protein [Pseudoneobacillus sp. C159]
MNTIKLTIPEKVSLILKMVIGSAISWELAILFGSKYPYLGPISLILCLQATLIKSIRFGIARIIGTIIGVTSVSILASSLHANGWSIAFIMLVSLIFPLLLGANATSLHQIAISVVLVLEFEHKLHGYGLDRIRDSIIGVAVALLLYLIFPPPNFTKRAIAKVVALPDQLANKLNSLAVWLEAGAPQQNYFHSEFKLLHKKLFEVEKMIGKAELSLKYNPVSQKSKAQLQEGELLLKTLHRVSADIQNLFHIMDEWSKTGSLTKESIEAWVQNVFLLESSFRNWNNGKALSEVVLNETSSNEKYSFPAIWHANHLLSTIKKNPRPFK